MSDLIGNTLSTATSALRRLTIDDLKELLGLALIEPDFRQRLFSDPAAVLATRGILATPESLRFFDRLKAGSFADASGLIVTEGVPRPPFVDFIK